MTDSVKFIFKSLIRVPLVIFFAYLILNAFTFCFTYFRMLGFSYVVMQTAVENNYLPESEYKQLEAYLNSISNTAFCENAYIVVNNSTEPGYDASIAPAHGDMYSRRQYGSTVRVGISFDFRMIWPLLPHEQTSDGKAVSGLSNEDITKLDSAQIDELREQKSKHWNTITISYTVPGLKYYPDLSN